jgi:hypothetical protein
MLPLNEFDKFGEFEVLDTEITSEDFSTPKKV